MGITHCCPGPSPGLCWAAVWPTPVGLGGAESMPTIVPQGNEVSRGCPQSRGHLPRAVCFPCTGHLLVPGALVPAGHTSVLPGPYGWAGSPLWTPATFTAHPGTAWLDWVAEVGQHPSSWGHRALGGHSRALISKGIQGAVGPLLSTCFVRGHRAGTSTAPLHRLSMPQALGDQAELSFPTPTAAGGSEAVHRGLGQAAPDTAVPGTSPGHRAVTSARLSSQPDPG